MRRLLLALLTTLLPAAAVAKAAAETADLLRTLKADHPRLVLNAASFARIQRQVAADPVAERIHKSVLATANRALLAEPPIHELRDGRRLLYVSREVLGRVEALSYAYLVTGERPYADRAWVQLDAAARFPDWNPAHFLDTAEMTHALAIGYDWLYDQWTPEQRELLRHAIVEKGLKPALPVYRGNSGWAAGTNNWNQVCNGGMTLGALAVADTDPDIARQILAGAVASVPLAMRAYLPDGAGLEGATYWDFGSIYNILMISSLRSALGTDCGLAAVPGFRQSGEYQIRLSGNDFLAFDFSDCGLRRLSSPAHFWMATEYGIPDYARFRRADIEAHPGDAGFHDLLWLPADLSASSTSPLPLDKHFRGAELVTMRDSWQPGEGFSVAIQGGLNTGSHRHLDLGSFILECDGVRWIIDSGKESETYQRHRNKAEREDFYRIRPEGHNTLVIDPGPDPGQKLGARAPVTRFDSRPDRTTAVFNLAPAYPPAKTLTRTFNLVRNREFTVEDRIDLRRAAEIQSGFHTAARVTLADDGRSATLDQGGKSLRVVLDEPAAARFELAPVAPGPLSPKPKQASNEGRSKLQIRLTDTRQATIRVRFVR